jgi:uncharacterized membrane protein (DUF485 family)
LLECRKKSLGDSVVQGVHVLRQYGIRPEAWHWYRVHGRVRPDPTPQYRAMKRRSARKSVLLLVLVVAAVVLAMPVVYWSAVLLHVSLYQMAPVTLGVLLVGVALFLAIFVAWAGAVREAREEAIREASRGRIFGSPGGVLAAAGKFGQGRVEAGARGEGSTALLLELLLRIPGTAVYHGLQFPGNQDADVDHAVAFGNIVYLLDSKLFRWGQYEWIASGDKELIVRSDGYGRGKANWMHAAAAGYRSLLGPEVEVIPMVMIHGRSTSVGSCSVSSHGVHMLTARDAMERIGDTIAGSLGLWQDNPAVRAALLSKLKTG